VLLLRAFRFYEPFTPLKLEEVPTPKLGPKDVLVKIKASGICGSDLHYRHGRYNITWTPLIPGHEGAGIVEKIGDQVEDFVEGDRVCVHYGISCGNCYHCNQGKDNLCSNYTIWGFHVDGSFAEYSVMPASNVFKLPKDISFEEGAIIGCAVSTAFHALKIGDLKEGDSVAVFGLGGVGMHVVQWARALGASLVIGVDVADYKLEMAKELGADVVIDARVEDPVERIKDIANGKGFKSPGFLGKGMGVDLALECAGVKSTVEQVMRSVCWSGRVVRVALYWDRVTLEPGICWEGGLRFSLEHTRDDLRRILELVEGKRIDLFRSITHRLPFEKLNEAIDILDEKRGNPLKVVVTQ
jgi:propanol-preferring alcohol dehydrogenase